MKNLIAILFTWLSVFNVTLLHAQSIERSVVASYGFAYSGPALHNSCTVGEVTTFTGQNSSTIVTHGFQQPALEDDLCIGGSNVTINANACTSYQLGDEVYTSSGTYVLEMLTAEGCDSIITLNLTLNALSNEVEVNNTTLTAIQDNATYSWIDCATQDIVGTEQSFSPTTNGVYQVQVSQEGCSALSDCIEVIVDGIEENLSLVEINIYPNPTRDNIQLEISGSANFKDVQLFDVAGKEVMKQQLFSAITVLPLGNLSAGVYLLVVNTDGVALHKPVIKE